MFSKKIIIDFYKSDALINSKVMQTFLHPDIILEWNSSKGAIVMDYQEILDFTDNIAKAYIRSKVRITHLIKEKNTFAVKYSHSVKTIENPREEILLANFFVIWELKDEKLFRGYQISQLL